MDKKDSQKSPDKAIKPPPAAFMLSQIGSHAATRFGERLAKVNLTPPHAGVLRAVTREAGLTQQALATGLGTVPSRLVVLLDDLENLGIIERRAHPSDRRSYAIYLTPLGEKTMTEVYEIGRQHQESLLASLNAEECKQLAALLEKIAEEQGLTPNVHPAYRNFGNWIK